MAQVQRHHGARGEVTMYYAEFQDLVSAYIGPFESVEDCAKHAAFVKARGDCAVYMGHVLASELPSNAFTLTPKEDRDYVPEW